MTIFTNRATEKKDGNDIPSPEVVSEYKMLMEPEKFDKPPTVAVRPSPVYPVTATLAVTSRRGRNPLLKLWAALLVIALLVIMAFVCYLIYKTIWTREMYHGRCGVRFRANVDLGDDAEMMPLNGNFEQDVTIDDMDHEKIEVPVIGDMKRSTVLHDFNQNVTAIIDRDQHYCFLLPLNRSIVMPPRDFWDLLVKLKTGYYIPDVDVVRETYRAVTPPVEDASVYGYNIWRECHAFDTYKLVREGEPIAMAKRSAPFCEFAGDQFCLGDAGATKMLCIGIKGCI
jgi:hypothetical protein